MVYDVSREARHLGNFTVSQLSGISGVSVRTLHYYDNIGLLAPDRTTEAGYRLYGGNELKRLKEIKFLKEAGFGLREIARILALPEHDEREALAGQRQLLLLQAERLQRLAEAIGRRLEGADEMNFSE